MSISEEEAEESNDWIGNHAEEYGEYKAKRIYLQEFRKIQKAILISQTQGTVLDRESDAYRHPDYAKVVDGWPIAVQKEESLLWWRAYHQNRIELYRTQQANQRRGY